MERRDFLTLLAAGAGSMAPLGRAAWAATAPASQDTRRKLVVVMLRGAADGLNIVAPVADADYVQARPNIALAAPGKDDGALDLDGYFGLHPALAPLMPLWQEHKLAFIHACGSPDPTRSHFDAQDYMESATPGIKTTPDGWMNRLASALPGMSTPTRTLSIGPVLPRILAGPAPAVNLASVASAGKAGVLERPALAGGFDKLYLGHPRYGKAYQDGREARREVMAAAEAQPGMQAETSSGMQRNFQQEMLAANNGAPLPAGFPDDAARLATLMRNDPNIQLAFFALGGWDTHAGQGAGTGQLANRLSPLALGLAQFAKRLGPMFNDTVVMVMSEFGRTVRENGNRGTDHGHGNAMWVMGGGVSGGKVLGDWRGLSAGALHEGRDVPVTTDFRAVLAQVAEQHLRLDARQLAQVFPGLPAGSRLALLG
ncbi:DUF1501 domain-containing protein [Pseudoduganella ginsengisoli]|uniref:DUF1501 domain-containing protein n=1 Tax=Pseudoduganella ginsengisoli TaxID=1462440 RepID=A0A6L6PVP0_9BURK|nr:DUF1501 domain-containing protein [Pseudoduganella ginsengisoli]MTW00722.1 DUF1501 domain-containing protein [Pseudoduganella ginsengisoli]